MKTHRKITVKYWNSLEEESRFLALRMVMPHLSEPELRYKAKQKLTKDSCIWDYIKDLKIPADNSYYKTVFVRETFIV